jgi:hypothetical protein
MKRATLLIEEVLYYLTSEWEDYVKKNENELWLTTRALQLKLQERGILTTWPTLRLKLGKLLKNNLVEKITTSAGECWAPMTKNGRTEN